MSSDSDDDDIQLPATVYFPSTDDLKTPLVGYLFTPTTAGRHPSVVLLHGRAGPYSTNFNKECTLVAKDHHSACDASTLSKRHLFWGNYWAKRGYLALLPDSFGPRNKAHGFGRGTHGDPDRKDVDERFVRPYDAQGALHYLQSRADVDHDRVFLQGWSNGGSTALNVMYLQAQAPHEKGFRSAMVLYPGCGPTALLSQDYKTGSPTTVFLASCDEEVPPERCQGVLATAENSGSPITVIEYQGATHDFDDPGKERQSIEGNRKARADVLRRAPGLFAN